MLPLLLALVFNLRHPAPAHHSYCYRTDRGRVEIELLRGEGRMHRCTDIDLGA